MAKKKGKPRRRHIPQRTCVGCREVQDKRSLIRLVRTEEGVFVDPDGKRAGRGAYLHNAQSCWQKGLDGRLARALKTEISAENMALLKKFKDTLDTQVSGSPSA